MTVTYNSRAVLDGFLESLCSQTFDRFRLYAIDNASCDGSADALEHCRDPRLSVVRNSGNVGFAAATNQGIEMALREGCTHVLMLNNDTTFPRDTLDRLLQAAARHRIVSPKIYFHHDPRLLWFAGGRFARWRGYDLIHVGMYEIDRHQYDEPGEIDAASGCCMLIEASVFSEVGLLDPRYFAYYEDLDFCLRARRAGIRIGYVPAAHVFHKASALTGGIGSSFSARLGARNKVYYVKKNFSAIAFMAFVPAYFAYFVARWLAGRDSWERFRLRTRAAAEGLKL